MLALLLIAQLRGPKPQEDTAYILPSVQAKKVDAKEINGLEIERKGAQAGKLVFFKSENGWRVKEPDLRADSSQINSLIGQLLRASMQEKEADMSAGFSHYGLDAPTEIITLRQGSEQAWTINIGRASTGKENALV